MSFLTWLISNVGVFLSEDNRKARRVDLVIDGSLSKPLALLSSAEEEDEAIEVAKCSDCSWSSWR